MPWQMRVIDGAVAGERVNGLPGGSVTPPPPTEGILGYTGVRLPLEPTGAGIRIDIGGGNNNHADTSTFDPDVLTPGSVVNIFWRATPYNDRLLFSKSGTLSDPIIINGVTDALGNAPQFDASNASTNFEERWNPFVGGGPDANHRNHAFWLVTRRFDTDPGTYTPEHIQFWGLDMFNANDSHSAEVNGVQRTYSKAACPIRVQGGAFITLQGNILHDSGNGFTSSDSSPVNRSLVIRGNHFYGNGAVGSNLEHQIYAQAVAAPGDPWSNIVEGNRVGLGIAGNLGGAIKVRGSDWLVRYNYVDGSSRAIDYVEPQGSFPDYIYTNFTAAQILERMRGGAIYGNVINVDQDNGANAVEGVFHCSGDTSTAGTNPPDSQRWQVGIHGAAAGEVAWKGVGAPVHVYANTVYQRSNRFRQSLFDMDVISQNNYVSEVVAQNNLVLTEPTAATSAGFVGWTHAEASGDLTYSGVNHWYGIDMRGAVPFDVFDTVASPTAVINGKTAPTLVVDTQDPLFVDARNASNDAKDFNLQAGSPARDAAVPLTGFAAQFPVEMQPNMAGGGASLRTTNNHLGAMETA